MNFYLHKLILDFKKKIETIEFSDFNYLYGQMGAGKSTVARLIDFCFGGRINENGLTPALQSEFLSATIEMSVGESLLVLRRDFGSNQIRASWNKEDELFDAIIPTRVASGEVVPGTGIEVLSDLIFFLAGVTPPKVRKSKNSEDSELSRLSFRDLLWYCYLDQDSMDSSFFHLEKDGDIPKRLKSRDVLRFLIGFYQEKVTELEVELESCRKKRISGEAGALAIRNALKDMDISSEYELEERKNSLNLKIERLDSEIMSVREEANSQVPHGIDELRNIARKYAEEVSYLDNSSMELKESIAKFKTHKNELLSLSSRFRRSQSARRVLSGVQFADCPSCGLDLPVRESEACPVCGQIHTTDPVRNLDNAIAEKDLNDRVAELSELVFNKEEALRKLERIRASIVQERNRADDNLGRASRNYDSVFLSHGLELEKSRSSLVQELHDLSRIQVMVNKIQEFGDIADQLLKEEQKIREKLSEARMKAEKDTQNLDRLKVLFLDCLTRAKISGFWPDDIVRIESPFFLPEISSKGIGDLAISSFSNLGSGGKKTLFKCCFAIAVHRLATEIGALLPSLLIIDSPMKNISERENRAQFEGFFSLLYELVEDELKGTQIILIDKELCSPPPNFKARYFSRHMRPNERNVSPEDNLFPPLISYYQGK